MQSLSKSIEQFIYPQYCNFCNAPLSQTALSISDREKNMYMAFHLTQTSPKAVLFIDDVLTTRSSADACARQLREGGSRWIGVVTLATTKKRKYLDKKFLSFVIFLSVYQPKL